MIESQFKTAQRAAAYYINRRRYGRAARVFAKLFGTSPRFLRDKEERQEWARRVLNK